MSKIPRIIAAAVLFIHGLIHLMGIMVYMQLGRSAILGGHLILSKSGALILTLLWVLAATSFVGTALGWLTRRKWSLSLLVGVSILSLVLTGLDWEIASTGAIVDIAVLAIVLVKPYLSTLFSRRTING